MYAHYDLAKYRHDDLLRAAARCRLGAPRRRRLTTAPARFLAGMRAQRIRPTSSRPQPSA